MLVKQIYDLVNDVTSEVLGLKNILKEDLTNVVDIGDAIFNANAFENYTRKLVDHIGKMVFVDRPYSSRVPSVLMDGWEFGSVLEKVSMELPVATENESWELTDGAVYEQDQFYKPVVSVKFYNSKVTFEVPISITEMQLRSAFTNAMQLNRFVSMIYSTIDKSLTAKLDGLIMRTINNFTGETIHDGNSVRYVKLLTNYNVGRQTPLTRDQALKDVEFLKYASYQIKLYASRMSVLSSLFNIGGQARHTPRDLMHIVLLDAFSSASDVYLQSDTFHNELVALPKYESVPYWQGTGTAYAFDDVSKIDIKTASGNDVQQIGIIGVIFDRDALGVTNQNARVTTHYNGKAEFTNMWHKRDASYFNDLNENFVVFAIA